MNIRVCSQTPTAGGRVLEQGDEKVLQLAHEKKSKSHNILILMRSPTMHIITVPVVIVFTQYDQLVRSKVMELRDKKGVTGKEAQERGEKEADESFKNSIQCLEILVRQLNIPLPKYVKVSGDYPSLSYVATALKFLLVRPGYERDVSELLAFFNTNSNVEKKRYPYDSPSLFYIFMIIPFIFSYYISL